MLALKFTWSNPITAEPVEHQDTCQNWEEIQFMQYATNGLKTTQYRGVDSMSCLCLACQNYEKSWDEHLECEDCCHDCERCN